MREARVRDRDRMGSSMRGARIGLGWDVSFFGSVVALVGCSVSRVTAVITAAPGSLQLDIQPHHRLRTRLLS